MNSRIAQNKQTFPKKSNSRIAQFSNRNSRIATLKSQKQSSFHSMPTECLSFNDSWKSSVFTRPSEKSYTVYWFEGLTFSVGTGRKRIRDRNAIPAESHLFQNQLFQRPAHFLMWRAHLLMKSLRSKSIWKLWSVSPNFPKKKSWWWPDHYANFPGSWEFSWKLKITVPTPNL